MRGCFSLGRWSWCLTLALLVTAVSAAGCQAPAPATSSGPNRHLLIVIDGLRPDYVTPEVMPNLAALGARGVVFRRHHSVYPTVTRVNASSISTGAYPETHGLLGNSVFFPRVDATRFLDTSDRENLLKVAATEGQLLTAPTMGEALQAAGRKMLVVSSGSSGSAFLNNHTVSGGAILHLDYALPEEHEAAMIALGRPAKDAPPAVLDTYAVDAFLKVGVPRVDPSVTVMWLSGLDSTAHEKGIGDPATVAILRHVDAELKRLEDGLKAAGLFDRYNLWVTSDHGFSTHTGAADLKAVLSPFDGVLPDGSPRIVSSGGAIYVRDNDSATVSAIVKKLQQTEGVGAIFTPASASGSLDGAVPGTLSFAAVRWTHKRSAQILFSPDWTDAENAFHMKGSVASGGTAGHGSTSPWDIHNTLIAAGPDLKQSATVDSPSGNVDFAPTFLTLLSIPRPPSMQGRTLFEGLVNGTAVPPEAIRTTNHTVQTPDGAYSATITFSTVHAGAEDFRYVDGAKVVRK